MSYKQTCSPTHHENQMKSIITDESNKVELDVDKQKQIWERHLRKLSDDDRSNKVPKLRKVTILYNYVRNIKQENVRII